MSTRYVYNEEIRQKIKENLTPFDMVELSLMSDKGQQRLAANLLSETIGISFYEAEGVLAHRDFYFETVLTQSHWF